MEVVGSMVRRSKSVGSWLEERPKSIGTAERTNWSAAAAGCMPRLMETRKTRNVAKCFIAAYFTLQTCQRQLRCYVSIMRPN